MDKREIRFDGWHVDFASGEISRDGRTQRLQDQPLQILDVLTSHAGEVVNRETLIARLWPKGVVEYDSGLNTAIRKLRSALGDDADTPRYVETLPRKGYRFIAPLTAAAPPPAAAPSISPPAGPNLRRRASDRPEPFQRLMLGFGSLVAAVLVAVIVWRMPGKLFRNESVTLPTIVVLPLVDMSIDQKEQALCDGLTDELSNWLAHIPTLRVVARTSAFSFKGKNTDVRDIARQVGATHVLEGSLRRSGNQLRIIMQLSAADTGLHIWAKPFDLPIGDIFLIEDTVSRSVADALHLELSPDTTEQWAQRQPASADAYELYLLGRARQRSRTADDNLKSADFLRRAVAADPQFALAQVALAETLLNGLSLNRTPIEDVAAEAEPLINRALTLSPDLPDALAAKGWLLTEEYRLDEALPLLKRATAANPNDAASFRFLGLAYERLAYPKAALASYTTAAGLDPLDFISQIFRCQVLVDLGNLDDANQACARARTLKPEHLWGPLATSWIARARGDTAGALQWIDAALKLAPTDEMLADQKIDLLLTQGKFADARAVIAGLAADPDMYSLARQANVLLAESGPAALKAWLDQQPGTKDVSTSGELIELARLQYLANDPAAARATLAHADRILPISFADLYDGSQIRHDYSAALFQAGIELEGGGDRAKAQTMLTKLDRLLDTYEKNGGRHYGLYSLRAASLAMQGRKDDAQHALDQAWKHGWRTAWRAHTDPFLAGVEVPGS